jgi:hypothetical protein
MNPYSHLVIAAKLAAQLQPENRQAYYWGAIAPDMRYLAAMPRRQTHIPARRILEFGEKYPDLEPFLQGYLVHCLSDEVDLADVFFRHLPFSVLRNRLSHRHLAVILELYHFERDSVNGPIAGAHNQVLQELGLDASVSASFSQSVSQYVTSSSPQSRVPELLRLFGMENDTRIEKYVAAAESFRRNWLLRNALFLGIRAGRISDHIAARTADLLTAAYDD